MHCSHCKAEWNVAEEIAKKLKNCPFCGESLAPKPPANPETLTDGLRAIVFHSGMEVFQDGHRLVALFTDFAPGLRREKTMLSYLVQCGGHTSLLNALQESPSQQTALRAVVVTRMMDDCLISQSLAEEACDSFWAAIGGQPVPAADNPLQQKVSESPADLSAQESEKISSPAEALYSEYLTIVNRQGVCRILIRDIQDLEANKKRSQGHTSPLQDQLDDIQKQKDHLQSQIPILKNTINTMPHSRSKASALKDRRSQLQDTKNELQTLIARESHIKRQIAADPISTQARHLIAQLDNQIRQKQEQLNQLRQTETADARRLKTLINKLCDPNILRELAWQPEKAAILQKDPVIRAAMINLKL